MEAGGSRVAGRRVWASGGAVSLSWEQIRLLLEPCRLPCCLLLHDATSVGEAVDACLWKRLGRREAVLLSAGLFFHPRVKLCFLFIPSGFVFRSRRCRGSYLKRAREQAKALWGIWSLAGPSLSPPFELTLTGVGKPRGSPERTPPISRGNQKKRLFLFVAWLRKLGKCVTISPQRNLTPGCQLSKIDPV